MNLKSRIKKLSTQIKSMDDQIADIGEKVYQLRTDRDRLVCELILEEKLLANTEWAVDLDGNDKLSLFFKEKQSVNKELGAMLIEVGADKMDMCLDMGNGIELWANKHIDFSFGDPADDFDIELSLHFKHNKVAVGFIKKHELKVEGKGLNARLAEMKRDVAALEVILHQFSGVV
jgi:hypothetical protein